LTLEIGWRFARRLLLDEDAVDTKRSNASRLLSECIVVPWLLDRKRSKLLAEPPLLAAEFDDGEPHSKRVERVDGCTPDTSSVAASRTRT